MNNPDHIYTGLDILYVIIFKFFNTDPEWKKFGSGVPDGKKKLEAGIKNIPDPKFDFFPSQIPDRNFSIPDPHQRI
jgi:hypothetical protein